MLAGFLLKCFEVEALWVGWVANETGGHHLAFKQNSHLRTQWLCSFSQSFTCKTAHTKMDWLYVLSTLRGKDKPTVCGRNWNQLFCLCVSFLFCNSGCTDVNAMYLRRRLVPFKALIITMTTRVKEGVEASLRDPPPLGPFLKSSKHCWEMTPNYVLFLFLLKSAKVQETLQMCCFNSLCSWGTDAVRKMLISCFAKKEKKGELKRTLPALCLNR